MDNELKENVVRGIYLVEPDGLWIAEGRKTAIVKKKPLSDDYVGQDVYLCSGKFCYGIINLSKHRKINLEEFKTLEDAHQVSDERRVKWWGEDTKEFYYYTIAKKDIFDKPKEIELEQGVQREIKEVKFKDISAGITTTDDIDIMEILYAPLKPEEKEKLQLERFRREGIDEDLSDPTKRYKQLIADLRYLGNGGFANFGQEGGWKEWTKEDILKYFAACVDALRSIYIALVPPSNEELYKKEHPGKDIAETKKTSYWQCYVEAEKYIESNPPKNEDELKEWKEKRKELLKKENETVEKKEEMDFLNIRPGTFKDLTDGELENLHKEGHSYWHLYETGKLKDIELLINNHVLLVQEMLGRDLKHIDLGGLDSISNKFFPGYDKKGFSLVFEHEQLHQEYQEDPCDLLFLQHFDSVALLMKNGYRHIDHGDELDKYYIWHNEHSLAHVNPSGEVKGGEIKLDEVMQYLKNGFRLRSPYVYLSGGIVNRGSTVNDIEIIVQCTQNELDSRQGHLLKWRIMRMFPVELAKRLHFLASTHIGPVTNNIPIYALSCERINENNDVFEMSINEESFEMKKALLRTKSPIAEKEAQKAKKTDKIILGEFFLPMKPTRGYKIEARGTISTFMELFEKKDFPIFSSKKFDGARHIIHKIGNKVLIWSEDGLRNEQQLSEIVEVVKALNVDELILDTEIESWVEDRHYPREYTSGLIHSKAVGDGSLVANVFDILWFSGNLREDVYKELQFFLKSGLVAWQEKYVKI